MPTKLKYGMIGGGPGSFIGGVHRMASRIDHIATLVAGCFSSDPTKSQVTGNELLLDTSRIYDSIEEMLDRESALPEKDRIDFVCIVTPNHRHADPAIYALQRGFPVLLDKPLTHSLDSAIAIYNVWEKQPLPFGLTYTYAGYPLILQARHMIKRGDLGAIRKVYVDYLQGWLSMPLELEGQKQAVWRVDPKRSGKAGAMGDIGSHAFHLAEFVSGLQATQLSASLQTKVSGRMLDDDGMVWLRFQNGASGSLLVSQVVTGAENNISIKVSGEKGTLIWEHEHQNKLTLYNLDGMRKEFRAGANYIYLDEKVRALCRTPGGHPEGYLEAFANQYAMFAQQVVAWKKGEDWQDVSLDMPNLQDGLRGMRFIEACLAQSQQTNKWLDFS